MDLDKTILEMCDSFGHCLNRWFDVDESFEDVVIDFDRESKSLKAFEKGVLINEISLEDVINGKEDFSKKIEEIEKNVYSLVKKKAKKEEKVIKKVEEKKEEKVEVIERVSEKEVEETKEVVKEEEVKKVEVEEEKTVSRFSTLFNRDK